MKTDVKLFFGWSQKKEVVYIQCTIKDVVFVVISHGS